MWVWLKEYIVDSCLISEGNKVKYITDVLSRVYMHVQYLNWHVHHYVLGHYFRVGGGGLVCGSRSENMAISGGMSKGVSYLTGPEHTPPPPHLGKFGYLDLK